MGERTQVLYEIKDEKDNLLTSQAYHYQWGYGRVMLMSVLHTCINLPWSFELHELLRKTKHRDYLQNSSAFESLKDYLPNRLLAYGFYLYLEKMADCDDAMNAFNWSHGDEVWDNLQDYDKLFNTTIDTKNKNQTQIFVANADRDDKLHAASNNLRDLLMLDPDHWFSRVDNNDGFMRVEITLHDDPKNVPYNYDYAQNTKWHFYDSKYNEISLKKYCNMPLNKQYAGDKFANGLSKILDSYDIKHQK